MEIGRKDFCIECRKETKYVLKKQSVKKTIRDKEFEFEITVAICEECGEEMSIPGLMDKNVKEFDDQYRKSEGLVAIEGIERLMKIYNIGKAPLSLALGFGEVTITRYLDGQIPSKEYSNIIKKVITSPAYMKNLLIINKEKIAVTAFNKAMLAVESIEEIFLYHRKC